MQDIYFDTTHHRHIILVTMYDLFHDSEYQYYLKANCHPFFHFYLQTYSRFPSKHPDLDDVYYSWIIIVLVSAQGSGYKPAQF